MNYLVFDDHIQGNSHKALGMECEDYSAHYGDPQGRYAIAVTCDGHSDPRCFRSAAGARLGCETAVELLKNLFECCADDAGDYLPELLHHKERTAARLRAAFVTEWSLRVKADIQAHPLTREELDGIPGKYSRERESYEQGCMLKDIYGATMLAAGVCRDFHVVMQIGDGIIVRLEQKGIYNTPLPEDNRGEGIDSPASMCDEDLLTRPGAFRIDFFPFLPQAVFCMSDGVGDMPLALELSENLLKIHRKLREQGATSGEGLTEVNDTQKRYLNSVVEYYSKRGLEDDCSIAGFFDYTQAAEDIRLTKAEVDALVQQIELRQKEENEEYERALRNVTEAERRAAKKVEEYRKELDDLQRKIDRIKKELGLEEADVENYRRMLFNMQKDHVRRTEELDGAEKKVRSYNTTSEEQPSETPEVPPAEPAPEGAAETPETPPAEPAPEGAAETPEAPPAEPAPEGAAETPEAHPAEPAPEGAAETPEAPPAEPAPEGAAETLPEPTSGSEGSE